MASLQHTTYLVLILFSVYFISSSLSASSCAKKKPKLDEHGCTMNQTYVTCNSRCPTDYCPKNDGPQPVCDAPKDCPAGCRCKINYRIGRKGNCILASECPPIRCTRPNEEFDPCPPACIRDSCENRNDPVTPCYTLLLNCQPQCVCKKNYWRNKDGLCVEACECE